MVIYGFIDKLYLLMINYDNIFRLSFDLKPASNKNCWGKRMKIASLKNCRVIQGRIEAATDT